MVKQSPKFCGLHAPTMPQYPTCTGTPPIRVLSDFRHKRDCFTITMGGRIERTLKNQISLSPWWDDPFRNCAPVASNPPTATRDRQEMAKIRVERIRANSEPTETAEPICTMGIENREIVGRRQFNNIFLR